VCVQGAVSGDGVSTPADWLLFALILLVTAVGYIGFVWALRSAAKWALFPGPKPDPTDELAVALHDLQVALSEQFRPPLERLTRWLAKHLP